MKWRDPTRVGAPGLDSSPVSKRFLRASDTRKSRFPASDSTTTLAERPPRRPPLTILDAIWGAVGVLVGIPQVRLGFAAEDDHPGWNISDEIDLSPRGECRYLIELVCGQKASVRVAVTHPVMIAVCDDDDYDSWQKRESWLASHCEIVSVACDGSSDVIEFRALRTGPYDLIFSNTGDQSTHATICIAAPPARQSAKGPGREIGLRQLTAFAIGDTRAVSGQQGRRP
jgi:hypothetical protein